MAPRILWVAKVSNLRPRSGSNISTALTRPMMPAPTRSSNSTEAGRFIATRWATYFTSPAYSTRSLSLAALLPVARNSIHSSVNSGIGRHRLSHAFQRTGSWLAFGGGLGFFRNGPGRGLPVGLEQFARFGLEEVVDHAPVLAAGLGLPRRRG